MELSDLKQNNPRQYYDLVASGKISYADAGALVWGAPVTMRLQKVFLVVHSHQIKTIAEPSDFSTPTTLAASGAYPKPWRSYAQRTQNATYKTLVYTQALVRWSDAIQYVYKK